MAVTLRPTAPFVRHVLSIGRDSLAASVLTWLGLVTYLALAKVLLDRFLPHAFAAEDQRAAFAWPVVSAVAIAGLIGAWFMHRTGFPAALDPRISHRERLLAPFLLGLVLGGLQIGIDLVAGYTRLNNAAHGVAQQYTGFLPMLLIFTAAPVIVETVYRFLPLPVLVWLISPLLLQGRWLTPVFWVLALLTSLWEPLEQTSRIPGLGEGLSGVLVAQGFALNVVEATMWRRAGFLAAIAVRIGFYLLWHVFYVH
jgi:hypothetical protein